MSDAVPTLEGVTGMSDERRDGLTLGQILYSLHYMGDTDWGRYPSVLAEIEEHAQAIVAEHARRGDCYQPRHRREVES